MPFPAGVWGERGISVFRGDMVSFSADKTYIGG